MLDRVPAIARPRAVSARMQTTAMRARSRPYSASACPSSRSWRDANHTRASLILESIRLLLSKLIDRLVENLLRQVRWEWWFARYTLSARFTKISPSAVSERAACLQGESRQIRRAARSEYAAGRISSPVQFL